MLYGWEGNRRSGVALAMRHRLSGIIIIIIIIIIMEIVHIYIYIYIYRISTYGLNGVGKGDEHPA